MFITKTKSGKKVGLLNPVEKGRKFAIEVKHKRKLTNFGKRKKDVSGNYMRLTRVEQAYRAGYLDARKDSAKAFKHNKKKKRY